MPQLNNHDLANGSVRDYEMRECTVYNDGELAFFDNIYDIHSLIPIKLEIYVCALITEGQAVFTVNGTKYTAHAGDLFFCSPRNVIEGVQLHADTRSSCVCISSEYVHRIFPLVSNYLDVFLEKCPIHPLQQDEMDMFRQYYGLICSKAKQPSMVQKKVIDTLMLAFIYDMHYALRDSLQARPHRFSSRESLFKRLIEELDRAYPRPRSVAYYADRLSVTPKYLSAVCKQVSDKRPSELIDSYVQKDIDYLMRHTQKSIKEIAFELDFPNLSFFGKYFKKHFGMSPKAYRDKTVEESKALLEAQGEGSADS